MTVTATQPDLRDEVEYLRTLVDRLIHELAAERARTPQIVREPVYLPAPSYQPWIRPWLDWTYATNTDSVTAGMHVGTPMISWSQNTQ